MDDIVPKSHFSSCFPAVIFIGHFPQEIDSKIVIYQQQSHWGLPIIPVRDLGKWEWAEGEFEKWCILAEASSDLSGTLKLESFKGIQNCHKEVGSLQPSDNSIIGYWLSLGRLCKLEWGNSFWRAIPNEEVIVINRRLGLLYLRDECLSPKGKIWVAYHTIYYSVEKSIHIEVLVHSVAFYVF